MGQRGAPHAPLPPARAGRASTKLQASPAFRRRDQTKRSRTLHPRLPCPRLLGDVLFAAFAAALVATAGCGAAARDDEPSLPVPAELQCAVGASTRLLVQPLPGATTLATAPANANAAAAARLAELAGERALVVASDGWREPRRALDPATAAALRQFVHDGGRLLLLGYAARLVHEIGIEPAAPDVCEPWRWGFDARTARGRARLGVQLVSGRLPELVDGMQPAAGREHAFFLTGGEPLCAPLCAWHAVAPGAGEVLAQLVQERDGEGRLVPAAVLCRWSHGKGAVLACGLEPDVRCADAALAHNAATFVARALAWLGRGAPPPHVRWWIDAADARDDAAEGAAAPDAVLPPAELREIPGARPLAHWGWATPAFDEAGARPLATVRDDVLLPSFAAGADTLLLQLTDATGALPLAWPPRDPLRPPGSYRSRATRDGRDEAHGRHQSGDAGTAWQRAAVGELAGEAHARGMLLQLGLDPFPAGEPAAERLATLRFASRELADVRRAGDAAADGVVLREWFRDDDGYATHMLQDVHPAASLLALGERTPRIAGAVAGVDAADGRPGPLRASGLARGWRDGFPGDLFPAGLLDATARRAGERATGGSFGDWIAQQAADFVRQRRDRGAAMLWRAHDPATLDPDTIDYVHGVGIEPLTAAVAARCTTIGTGGWRDAQRALLPDVQRGFGAMLPVPAATVLLQNNRLRLCGSGGALLFDPRGLALLQPADGAVVLAREFLATRLSGVRPDAEELRAANVDLLAGGRRGEGRHAWLAIVPQGDAAPATLAFGDAPRWPQRCEFALPAELGRFELTLRLRPLQGRGVVTAGVDGELLWVFPFESGRLCVDCTVPVHLARGGARSLWLEVADGGSVALEALALRRAGDVAAEAAPLLRAGAVASVREDSASTYHAESVELATVADFPGLLVRLRCQRAARSLQVERRFGFVQHTRLRQSLAGDPADRLRSPFVLAAADASLPDLLVVPLQLSRYERFELRADGLVLVSQPEAGAETRFGFWLLPRERAVATLPHAAAILRELDLQPPLPLGDVGTAELRSDLPVPWPRVVRCEPAATTPCLVRENGWWTWRGVQQTKQGSLLAVHQRPGDTVQIVRGPAVLARTRPAPGSLHVVALRDPAPDRVTVAVLQPATLAPAAVTMGADFDEVLVDGRPWSAWSGRTVLLPCGVGRHDVVTRRHGGSIAPHVTATRAPLEQCTYDAAARELVLVVRADPSRPPELPFTAVIAGPTPVEVEGGEVVPEGELRHASPADAAAAAANGTLIRFRAGIVRVRHGR